MMGSVGVGNNAPGTLLNVGSASTANPTIRVTSSVTDGSDTSLIDFGFHTTWTSYAGMGIDYSDRGTEGLKIFTAAYPMSFQPSGVTRMHIDTTGNVGIGTVSPAEALSVVGKIVSNSATTDATLKQGYYGVGHYTNVEEPFIGVRMSSSSGSNVLDLGGGTAQGNAATVLLFTTGANNTTTTGAERMRIDNNGNVGIGTSTPVTPLEVNGAIRVGGAKAASLNATYHTMIVGDRPAADGIAGILLNPTTNATNGTNAGMGISYNSGTGYLSFNNWGATGAPALMTIERTSGKVGIGTTSPSELLSLFNGNLALAGGTYPKQIYVGNSTNFSYDGDLLGTYGLTWYGDSVLGGLSLGISDFYGINFFTGGANNRLTITGSGNVGIGTTSPGEKLEVNGNVKATAYLVSSDERLKYEVREIKNALNAVLRIRGVTFKWKENSREDLGFIAQQIETVLPELVHTDKNTGLKSVQYANVVAVLVAAIQEQQIALTLEKQKNVEQDQRLQRLESVLRKLGQ